MNRSHAWAARLIAVMIAVDVALCWHLITASADTLVSYLVQRPTSSGMGSPFTGVVMLGLALAGVVAVIGLVAYRRFGLWAAWAFLLIATIIGLGGVPYVLRPLKDVEPARSVVLLTTNVALAAMLWWAMSATKTSARVRGTLAH